MTNGYHIVGLAENGFRNITNNVRPINVPADLQASNCARRTVYGA